MIRTEIFNLELERWTAEVGPDINDPPADNYRIVQTPEAMSLVMCSSLPYSGWLAKQVSPLIFPAARIRFRYQMMIDDATLECAQVAETDAKITDCEGWTYDLSAQWNIADDWMFQVDHEGWAWTDTGLRIEAPEAYDPQDYIIEYRLDYAQKRSSIVGVKVEGDRYDLAELWVPARQVGWGPEEIVTQLQQCNNAHPGGYTLRFSNVGYVLEG